MFLHCTFLNPSGHFWIKVLCFQSITAFTTTNNHMFWCNKSNRTTIKQDWKKNAYIIFNRYNHIIAFRIPQLIVYNILILCKLDDPFINCTLILTLTLTIYLNRLNIKVYYNEKIKK